MKKNFHHYTRQLASLIIPDSGGVQKETFFYQKPCIIVGSETEWVELITHKCSILSDTKPNLIVNAYQQFTENLPLTSLPSLETEILHIIYVKKS